MLLHQTLAELARDHGHGLFGDAAAFRGSLDDYLDEGQASSGTINLLTDAVRLGALDGLLTMLDSGAKPADAVESAGQRLARDRGSADVRGCQWAVAVLGFALGRVPEQLVTGLDPDAATAAPPTPPAPMTSPVTSPVAPHQQPIMSPAHQPPAHQPTGSQQGPGYGAPVPAYGGWSQSGQQPGQQPGQQKKSRTGLIIGAVVLALVLIVGGIVGAIALAGGDDDPSAGDDPTATESSSEGSEEPTEDVRDLGGPTIEGNGYSVQVPKGWSDGTDEFVEQNPGLTTLDRVLLWGTTFNTARGNVIVETQSSYGNTEPEPLKTDWKEALVSSDPTADISDIDDTEIDGQKALGVDISRTNEADVEVQQRSYLVISGDKGYSITVSLKDGDEDVIDRFEEILTTWQWTS